MAEHWNEPTKHALYYNPIVYIVENKLGLERKSTKREREKKRIFQMGGFAAMSSFYPHVVERGKSFLSVQIERAAAHTKQGKWEISAIILFLSAPYIIGGVRETSIPNISFKAGRPHPPVCYKLKRVLQYFFFFEMWKWGGNQLYNNPKIPTIAGETKKNGTCEQKMNSKIVFTKEFRG